METKNTANAPGIIGQMYEERKSKKLGVLESRNEKFKTLMMRDKDGGSFNVQYSTFRSNWRKYQGEEVIQTSSQVEEAKVEEVKEVESAKTVVEKKSESVKKVSTEEKVKKIRAISTLLQDVITKNNYSLKIERNSKGGILVRYATKKIKVMELWYKFNTDSYEMVVSDNLYDSNTDKFNSIGEHIYKDKWIMKHLIKFGVDSFEHAVSIAFSCASDYVNTMVANKNNNEENE